VREPGPLAELIERLGTARRPERQVARPRPEGVDDTTVFAVGKLSEAMEAMEDARGHLYAFHRLTGRTEHILQDALNGLREAGHAELAEQVEEILLGRDVLPGLWTFQIVENYDAHYAQVFREVEARVRELLVEGRPHIYEAEMKCREQGANPSTGAQDQDHDG
jgi:hypothetical protein